MIRLAKIRLHFKVRVYILMQCKLAPIGKGLRKTPVGIVGTNYRPLDNQHQIKEAVEKLVKIINKLKNPIEKALTTVIMISYIQPFEDGNKRTGRILANAILLANNYCPLSYRSIDEAEYKKAVIIFYENNSLAYFKELFIEQFNFAVDKYF
jgi:Fic family protein